MPELLWYNCFPVFGLSVWWLYCGANGDLLQEEFCPTLDLPALLQPELLSLWQASADLCFHRRHSNTQRKVCLSLLWGLYALMSTRICVSPLSICGRYGVLFLNVIFLLLPSRWGFSFALWCGLSFFGGIQYSPVNGCSAASCNFGVLTGDMSARPSTP